jgi:hypothetical protein
MACLARPKSKSCSRARCNPSSKDVCALIGREQSPVVHWIASVSGEVQCIRFDQSVVSFHC